MGRINFGNLRYDSPLGKLVRLPLALIPKSFVVPILQGKMRGMRWVVGASSHGCWLGSVEIEKQTLLEELLHPSSVFYDIGGHVGLHTLLASRLVGVDGKVIAFEPFPRNISYLRKHIELNDLRNVQLFERAVSDVEETVGFVDGAGDSSEGMISEDGEIQVQTVVIDRLIERGEIPPPDVMKIDVEGAELMVLRGAKDTLLKHRPTITFATHGDQVKEQCLSFLAELGYEVKPIQLEDWQEEDEFIATYSEARTS